MATKSEQKNVKRCLDNFYSMADFNTTMTVDEVNYYLENFDTLVICRGHGRRVKFDKITEKMFKVYSERL